MTKGRAGKREGAAAVEFAMVILPFTFMIFALLELGLIFVVDSVLGNATIESGRYTKVGTGVAIVNGRYYVVQVFGG